MKKLTKYLTEPLINENVDETIKIDVSVGDTILTGRFKNKKVKVKKIGKDEYGMPTINGKKVVSFRMGKDKDFLKSVTEAPRVPRKKGQHRGSKSHSDLYTDENPKGTIKGLKFATVKDAKASVSKIRGSGRSHAHKIQAAVAMEQRAREMGKTSQAAVYRAYINKMKKKTKKKNEVIKPSTHYGYYKVINGKNIIQFRGSKSDVRRQLKKVRKQDPKGKYQLIAGGGKVGSVFEEFGAPKGFLPSPSRKMVKKMKKKGNTSVPYGSGYKKVNEANAVSGGKVSKFITGHNLTMKGKKYKEIEFETLGVDNSSKMVKLRIIAPKNLFGMETPVKFSTLRRGPFTKTETGKKVNEDETKTIQSLLQRFGNSEKDAKKMIKKNYKKVNKKFKNQTPRDKAMALIGLSLLGERNINKVLDSYMKNVVYSIVENTQIKKVIGIFGGRFQPFHSGHLATYKWLASKVDEAYITTSNIKQPPRHPMNFNEKVRHMVKMGVPKNRIVQEKTPYIAANLLKKFDPKTTAVVYAFGEKDAGRLKGGVKKDGSKTYYQDFQKNKNNLEGFDVHGYYVTAPQAGKVSGTMMRKILGDPSLSDKEREKSFKDVFGYYDKGVYNMMTNKFKKLFETYKLSDELIEEFLIEVTDTTAGNLDDGPSTYYKSLDAYKKDSKAWLDSLYSDAGWKVIDYMFDKDIIKPEDNVARADDVHTRRKKGDQHYTSVALSYLDHGQARGSNRAVNKYKSWMSDVVKPLGWEVVSWMGTDAAIDNVIGTLLAAGADGDSYDVKLKEQINPKSRLKQKSKEKELLLMGGAYGHLNHPFDDKNLTFGDFKTLIINTLQGRLDSEGAVTEKTDGQNIMISWKNNKLIAARNKGHIKNFGANALDIKGVKNMFSGRGDIEKAFVSAMQDLQKAISGLSKKQKDKIFGNGKKFMSLEVIYPKTANVIPYDKSLLQFHGTIEYDEFGSPIGDDRDSARILAGMIKQINQNVQKTYSITKPFVTSLPKVKNFSEKQSYFLGKLAKLKNEYKLSDKDTLADYHQAYWTEYIYNGAKQTDYPNPSNDILMKLTKRWAFFDKSYKIPQIRKDLEKYPKFLDWFLTTDKMDHAKLQKQHIRDWEVLFFELGAEILSNLKDFIAANPSDATQKMKKDLASAINQVRKSKDPKVLNTLKTQLDRLNAIGGLKAVVPTEGITFVYKGKLFKYTGAFAPANQILGMLKFV